MRIGFVQIQRAVIDSLWYSDPDVRSLVMHLAMTVNHSPGFFMGETIAPGSRATSVDGIAHELGWTRSKCNRVIEKAVSKYGIVDKKSNSKWTTLTLDESVIYRADNNTDRTTNEQRTENHRTANEQRTDTIEEQQYQQEEPEKQDPPPQTPPQVPESAAWREEEDFLKSFGVTAAPRAIAAARERGLRPSDVRRIVDHYRSRPGAWGPGALFARVSESRPGDDPATGWPPVAGEAAGGDVFERVLLAAKTWSPFDPDECKRAESMLSTDELAAMRSVFGGFAKLAEMKESDRAVYRNRFLKGLRDSSRGSPATTPPGA